MREVRPTAGTLPNKVNNMSTSLTVTINSIYTTRKHQIEEDNYFKKKTAKVHEIELITHSHLVKRLTLHGNQYQ